VLGNAEYVNIYRHRHYVLDCIDVRTHRWKVLVSAHRLKEKQNKKTLPLISGIWNWSRSQMGRV